jgi:hypothetical protein
VPEHLFEEDRRIIKLIEYALKDKDLSLHDLETQIIVDGFSKTAFQRALSKARLRQYNDGTETTYGANYHMLFRYLDKQYQSEKAPENHARAHSSQAKDDKPIPRQPTHPKDLTVSRQAA